MTRNQATLAAVLLLSLAPAPAFAQGKGTPAAAAQAAGNKALARRIIESMWLRKDPEAAAKLLAPDYVEHMPAVSQPGVAGFVAAAKGILAQFPKVSVTIHQLVAEGDMVAAYVNWKPVPGEPGYATGEFFRFRAGKLAEHWSVAQPVPTGDAARNPIGMF